MKALFTNAMLGLVALSCHQSSDVPMTEWQEQGIASYAEIQHGLPTYEGVTGVYKRKNEANLTVSLAEPSVVSVADQEYGWGYFQFPNIYRALDGRLVVSWNMGADAAESYGKGLNSFAVSSDEGKTWEEVEGE